MYFLAALFLAFMAALRASAQIAPTDAEWRAYSDLHAAAARGDVADIERRIASPRQQSEMDANIPDGSGATPLKLARDRGYREMAAILEKAGAK